MSSRTKVRSFLRCRNLTRYGASRLCLKIVKHWGLKICNYSKLRTVCLFGGEAAEGERERERERRERERDRETERQRDQRETERREDRDRQDGQTQRHRDTEHATHVYRERFQLRVTSIQISETCFMSPLRFLHLLWLNGSTGVKVNCLIWSLDCDGFDQHTTRVEGVSPLSVRYLLTSWPYKTHTHTHALTHARTHTCTHTHARTHACIHTHNQIKIK